MFSDREVIRQEGTFKHNFTYSSKTTLQLFLKIFLKCYKFNFTCLASSKQTSGPFLYLGCLTISQGFGPSSVLLVKEHDFFFFFVCASYITRMNTRINILSLLLWDTFNDNPRPIRTTCFMISIQP